MSSQESVRFVKGAVCRPGQRTVAGSCGTPGRERLLSREKSEELLKSLYVARLCHRSLKTPSQTAECVGSQAGRKSGAVIKHKELEKGKREREKEKEGKKGGGRKGRKSTFWQPHNRAFYRERGIFLHSPRTTLLAPEEIPAITGNT